MKTIKAFDDLVADLTKRADQNADGKIDRADLDAVLAVASARFTDDLVENLLIAIGSFGLGIVATLLWRAFA